MLLTVDVGNTNVTLGVFDGENLRTTLRIETDINRMGDEYAATMLTLLGHHSIKNSEINEAAMKKYAIPGMPFFE